MEVFIYITAAMLITVFINITAAGWLSIKMAEFMWLGINNRIFH